MQTVEEILEAAERLPENERERLIEKLANRRKPDRETGARRRAAMEDWLAMAGTVDSDFIDVSTNKGKHLAEIYADKR